MYKLEAERERERQGTAWYVGGSLNTAMPTVYNTMLPSKWPHGFPTLLTLRAATPTSTSTCFTVSAKL